MLTTEVGTPLKILVVDDDRALVRTLEDILELKGYDVVTASEGTAALRLLLELPDPAIVALLDIGLPDISGLDVALKLQESHCTTQVIILTGDASVESAIGAVRADTVDYLVKPVQPLALLETIGRAAERGLRRIVEAELERERKHKSDILDAMPVGMAVLTVDGDVTYLNRAAVSILGVEGNAGDTHDPTGLSRARAWLSELMTDAGVTGRHDVPSVDRKYFRPDGRAVRVSCTSTLLRRPGGVVDGVLKVFWDVTEQRRLEEGLRQAQKMEAVGRLAGGVAHDFNNALTVILAHADLLLGDLGEESPHREDAEAIREAGRQASDVAAQLLTFSRRSTARIELVDLNEVIRGISGLLTKTLGAATTIRQDLDDRIPIIEGDPGQFRQVLMNLAINARDAMAGGGVLTFRTFPAPTPEGTDRVSDGEAGWVVVEVEDDGAGMDEATRGRIFEPFFTTKGEGRGTGLGLASVYGIVSQLGGSIDVQSEVGHGTMFSIRLPSRSIDRA